jgi:parallel beta-helix repeat protein
MKHYIVYIALGFALLGCKTDKQTTNPEPVEKNTKISEKKSYYQNGKLRTIEIFNKKNQVIETKLYDSINGNLLAVLTSASAKTKLNDWYGQYFNQKDILQIKYGDLNNNGISEDAIVLIKDDESTDTECFVFIKNENGGFIKEGQNFDIAIDRDSISIEFLEQGFSLNTKHNFEHEWKRSLSFRREEQGWYLDKDVFIDAKGKDYVFVPKEAIKFADFNPEKNIPEELGIDFEYGGKDRNVVVVSSVKEFLDSIDDYTTIYLKPGKYNLSSINDYRKRTTEEGIVDNLIQSFDDTSYENRDRNSNSQLLIDQVSSLSIIGLGKVAVTTDQDHASVIEFQNCNNILLQNIESYHNAEEYTCSAPVISFNESKNSKVGNCVLNGSGETGIALYSSKNIVVEHTTMTNCSSEGIYLKDSDNCYFYNCKVVENNTKSDGNIIDSQSSSNIVFKNCVFANNNLKQGAVLETRNDTLVFNNCIFKNNISGEFLNIQDYQNKYQSRLFMVRSKYKDTKDYGEYITKINDSFSVVIVQDGKKIKIVNNVVKLYKKPFNLIITQPKGLSIKLSTSFENTAFQKLKQNIKYEDIKTFEYPDAKTMADDYKKINPIYIDNEALAELRHFSKDSTSYNAVKEKNGGFVELTRIIDSFATISKNIDITNIDRDIYLSLLTLFKVKSIPDHTFQENQRFYLKLEWIN